MLGHLYDNGGEGLARSSVLLPFLKMIIHILREGVCGFILRRKRCKGSHTVILFSEPVIHFSFVHGTSEACLLGLWVLFDGQAAG